MLPRRQRINDTKTHIRIALTPELFSALDALAMKHNIGDSWRTLARAVAKDDLMLLPPVGPYPTFADRETAETLTLWESEARALWRTAAVYGLVNTKKQPSVTTLLYNIATGEIRVINAVNVYPDPVYQRGH